MRTSNIERRTSNVQRRTEENQRVKENAFSLFLSPLMFDVRRSMLNVRCSYSFFRCEMFVSILRCEVFVFILPDVRCSMLNAERALASLEKSCEALTGILEENANAEHRTPNFQRRTEENQERKETPSVCSFRLFGSTFGVECSMFDVRINLTM